MEGFKPNKPEASAETKVAAVIERLKKAGKASMFGLSLLAGAHSATEAKSPKKLDKDPYAEGIMVTTEPEAPNTIPGTNIPVDAKYMDTLENQDAANAHTKELQDAMKPKAE